MAKQNTIEHLKTFRLADLLEVEPWAALGLLEAFWDWVGQNAPNGDVTPWPLSKIARGVAWGGDPKRLMHVLRLCGIVEELPGGTLYVHDYHDHAPDMYRKRLENSGKSFANGFPARKPKVGNHSSYELAGHVKPTPVPYIHGESPTRPTASPRLAVGPPRPALAASRRRVPDSPEPPKNTPDGESPTRPAASPVCAEAHPIPSHPIPEESVSLSGTGGGAAEPGGDGESNGMAERPASPASPSGTGPGGRSPAEGPPGVLPTYVPGQGRALIERSRRPGESDEQVRRRLHAERAAVGGEEGSDGR